MSRDLSRLFRPRSVAVIGGGAWAENALSALGKIGFTGRLAAVHPRRERIAGVSCVTRPEDLPFVPDAAWICVNRHATVEAVAALSAMGAGGAVCFASGFAEAADEDGEAGRLQARLVQAAGRMPILGPNCYGFVNYLDRVALWPDQHGGRPVARGVGIVTQSSNLAINLTMQRRGLPLAVIATAGNQAQTGLAEIGAAFLEDPRITALGLHVEGVGDPAAFEDLARLARRLEKPVVVLKTGRSAAARRASLSHTASLAGSDAGARALFRRLGFGQVAGPGAFLECLKILHVTGALPAARIAACACSGGEAGLVADMAAEAGLGFVPLSDAQKADLRDTLGPLVRPANPLDYHTRVWGDAAAMGRAFAVMAGPEAALTLVIADFPRTDRCRSDDWDCVLTAVRRAHRQTGRPFAILSSLPESLPEPLAEALVSGGIVPLSGLADALPAIRAAADAGAPAEGAGPLLPPAPPDSARLWPEDRAKAALAAQGVAIPRSATADTAAALPAACKGLAFPVVLKALGHAHKTEAGAIALDLATPEAVTAAARTMPEGPFLVEEMVTGAVAELLVGVVLDPAHGYVLTLGAGGVLAEVIADRTSLLLPMTAPQVEAALARLRIAPLLRGHRGRPPADMPALVDTVLALQAFVAQHHGRIAEVEINPLLALPRNSRPGAVAVDALIRAGEPE